MSSAIESTQGVNRQVSLMDKARNEATFDSYKLTCILYKGEDTVRRRRAAFKRVEEALGTADQSVLPKRYANTDRQAIYLDGVQAGTAAFLDGIKYNHDFFNGLDQHYTLSNCTPYGLHYMMFMPTIELQGTQAQIDHWIPRAKRGEICGCYCQTELAHGTFVRGIETTATLDLNTDEFIIDSPTLTSAKFWPGAMASSCTHGILMARLIIGTRDYGVHAFIIPLRRLDTFEPVSGVELGDIGMKMGYNGTTNGYAVFRGLRIPRDYMLMRHAKVSSSGVYTGAQHEKVSYITMLHARAVIAAGSGFKLAQAATIATRYSAVREQGAGFNGEASTDGSEVPILQYRSQNFRLLSLMARAYAIHFTGDALRKLEEKLKNLTPENGYASMGLYHTLLAGYKAWNTQVAADGAEDARKACGGHGFVLTSGLPSIVAEATAPATFEGENYVMYQQVGRYLLKCWKALKEGRHIDGDGHLDILRRGTSLLSAPGNQHCKASGTMFLSAEIQCTIFEYRACHLLDRCSRSLENTENSGKSPAQAWNKHMMETIAAARAYMDAVVLREFVKHEEEAAVVDTAVYSALSRLRALFALTTITHPQSYDAISFMSSQYLNDSQMVDIRDCVDGLLDGLLPDAIALTDAWDFTDASLCSAIGRYDGNVYETLMAWTRQMPINQEVEGEGSTCRFAWEKWIKPALTPVTRARL